MVSISHGPALPNVLMEEIGTHVNFFTKLYMGLSPCICEQWDHHPTENPFCPLQRIETKFHVRQFIDYNKQRDQQRFRSLSWRMKWKDFFRVSTKLTVKELLFQFRSLHTRLQKAAAAQDLFDDFSEKSCRLKFQYLCDIYALLKDHRITSSYKEGLPFLWIHYLKLNWSPSSLYPKNHWQCIENVLKTLIGIISPYQTDDFERKRDF